MPLRVIVSHSLWATLSTVNRLPQNLSISGMNGRASSSPRSSSVARISASGRTTTTSPTFRSRRARAAAGRISTAVLAIVHSRPAQLGVETALGLQPLDLVQPDVATAEELVLREVVAPVGLVELLDTLPDRPARLELRQDPLDPPEVDPVVPGVGTGALGEAGLAAGDGLHHLGHLAHPEVLLGDTDVERLVVRALAVDLERGQEGPADVLDVDQRPPR